MQPSLKQIEAFYWVAKLGSFRRAADRLHTTQPNISARISALENMLDVHLMDRDAGSVRLSSQGEHLLEHAQQVLNATNDFVQASGRPEGMVQTLRLGVTEIIVQTWLREFLRQVKECYPDVSVELTVDLSINLDRFLTEGTIDLALQNAPFDHPVDKMIELGDYSMIWVAAPNIQKTLPSKLLASDLLFHPILTHSRGSRIYTEVSNQFASERNPKAKFVPSSNLAACRHMTLDGMGIATLPAVMVANDVAKGDLARINYKWVPEPLKFFARFDKEISGRFLDDVAKIARDLSKKFAKIG